MRFMCAKLSVETFGEFFALATCYAVSTGWRAGKRHPGLWLKLLMSPPLKEIAVHLLCRASDIIEVKIRSINLLTISQCNPLWIGTGLSLTLLNF